MEKMEKTPKEKLPEPRAVRLCSAVVPVRPGGTGASGLRDQLGANFTSSLPSSFSIFPFSALPSTTTLGMDAPAPALNPAHFLWEGPTCVSKSSSVFRAVLGFDATLP